MYLNRKKFDADNIVKVLAFAADRTRSYVQRLGTLHVGESI